VTSISDLHCLYADPDPTFKANVDPDPALQMNVDPNPGITVKKKNFNYKLNVNF
jgi:hypothetical protein